jgi:hypothetical protein
VQSNSPNSTRKSDEIDEANKNEGSKKEGKVK